MYLALMKIHLNFWAFITRSAVFFASNSRLTNNNALCLGSNCIILFMKTVAPIFILSHVYHEKVRVKNLLGMCLFYYFIIWWLHQYRSSNRSWFHGRNCYLWSSPLTKVAINAPSHRNERKGKVLRHLIYSRTYYKGNQSSAIILLPALRKIKENHCVRDGIHITHQLHCSEINKTQYYLELCLTSVNSSNHLHYNLNSQFIA